MKRTMLSPFAPPAVAAIAALGLASPAAAAPAVEPSPAVQAADANVKVNSARVARADGTVTVNVTYSCATATNLAVVVGQPPRNSSDTTKRVAAGEVTPSCDGRTRTIDVRTEAQSGSSGTWQTGAPATLGAVVLQILETRFQVVARDSRTLDLS
ncbi:hypothetical protein ACQEU3_43965 [Spirillospora sp. CA-253888]